MARGFRARPDGLSDVTLEDGTVIPIAFGADDLQGLGFENSGAAEAMLAEQAAAKSELPSLPDQRLADLQGISDYGYIDPTVIETLKTQAQQPLPEKAPEEPKAPEAPTKPEARANPGELYDPYGRQQMPEIPQQPARFIPGKFQTTDKVTEFGPSVSPEAQQARSEVLDQREAIAQSAGEAQMRLNRLAAQKAEEEAELSRQRASANMVRRAAQETDIKNAIAERQKIREARQKAVGELGKSTVFGDGNALTAIVTGLLIGIGSIGSERRGGRNFVSEAINASLARDLEVQKQKIAAVDGDLDASDTHLGQLYKQHDSAEEAEREYRIDALAEVKTKYDALMASAQDEVTKAKIAEAIADVDAQRAELVAQNNAIVARREVEKYQPGQVVGGQPDLKKVVKDLELRRRLEELIRPNADPLIVEGYGRARSEKAAEGAVGTVISSEILESNLSKLDELEEMKPPGWEAEAQAIIRNSIAPALARIRSSGFNPGAPQEEAALEESEKSSPVWRDQGLDMLNPLTPNSRERREGMRRVIRNQKNVNLKQHIPDYVPEKSSE